MSKPLKIDFVSDLACPWCIIGLRGLEIALERTSASVEAEITFHPFELNPDMEPGGENIVEHVGRKYGYTPEQSAASRVTLRQRAADVGFTWAGTENSRMYNTFDAHRLLFWAREQGKQHELEKRLFKANFTEQRNLSDHEVLIEAAGDIGLSKTVAADVLSSARYGVEVKAAEGFWQARGIQGVPAIIFNDKYLVSGAQPPEAFQRMIEEISLESA